MEGLSGESVFVYGGSKEELSGILFSVGRVLESQQSGSGSMVGL